MSEDIFNGLGVEIRLIEPNDYHIIQETLSRIGYASIKEDSKTLFQSCHIFHKAGRYAIMHFKEMLAFDGKPTEISDNDIARRNKIVLLLSQWDLIDSFHVDGPDGFDVDPCSMQQIKIVKHTEKNSWQFVQKYTFSGTGD